MSAAARCVVAPMPLVEYAIRPGSARARAINSGNVATPRLGLATIRKGCSASRVIGTRDVSGSTAMEGISVGNDVICVPVKSTV